MFNTPPFKQFIDFSIPQTCLCGEFLDSFSDDTSGLCSKCWSEIQFNSSNNSCSACDYPLEYDFGGDALCPSCIKEKPIYDKAQFCFKYDDITSSLITKIKYYDKMNYIPWLANLMFGKIDGFDEEIDVITSVPVNKRRMLKRKFNQSALLANAIERKIGRKLSNHNLIHRCKNIPPQTGLSRKQRLKNVKDAFEINNKFRNRIEGLNILLIDDVYTTGATISECCKMLRQVNVDKIYVLTAARTII